MVAHAILATITHDNGPTVGHNQNTRHELAHLRSYGVSIPEKSWQHRALVTQREEELEQGKAGCAIWWHGQCSCALGNTASNQTEMYIYYIQFGATGAGSVCLVYKTVVDFALELDV